MATSMERVAKMNLHMNIKKAYALEQMAWLHLQAPSKAWRPLRLSDYASESVQVRRTAWHFITETQNAILIP